MSDLIIAIDGPSGVGKSTLSKLLARRLGYINIDTGAMYRSVALAARRQSVDPSDQVALQTLVDGLSIDFIRTPDGERVLLDGEDVSEAIRSPEVSQLTPKIAAIPLVRRAMVRKQREMGATGGVVLEGRDIGTVVFPDAGVKFFMVASAAERGRRRFDELKARGVAVDLPQTIREVEQRDSEDSRREHSPLVMADDAVEIDTTGRSIDQVLDVMIDIVMKHREGQGG